MCDSMYKKVIRACDNYKSNLVSAIQNKRKDVNLFYFEYFIGINELIKKGICLLSFISNEYDFTEYKFIPSYKFIDIDCLILNTPNGNENIY